MLPFQLALSPDRPLRLLCLGAHCDDIEIGAGGFVRRLLSERQVDVRWHVLTSDVERQAEARASAEWFCADARELEVAIDEFPMSFLPTHWEPVKRRIAEFGAGFEPHLVVTHRQEDRHQDHRVLGEVAWQVFRDRLILEYEIAKWEGDLGNPNFYVVLEEDEARAKAEAVERFFRSQSNQQWFDAESFLGLMRLRGIECASPSRFAEAFHARKICI